MPDRKLTFTAKSKEWAREQNIHGVQAFSRYVMFTFLECLAETSKDFIFKGGNLLWLYIRTPRHTIDLDFATKSLAGLADLRKVIETACAASKEKGIHFRVKSIKEIEKKPHGGAAISIEYQTEEGASNVFSVDIVYKIPTKFRSLPSPLGSKIKIPSATVENILLDKLTTMAHFKGGNTRMKDIDDVWRIMNSSVGVDWKIVAQELEKRDDSIEIQKSWVNVETAAAWERHIKRYKDLPKSLEKALSEIGRWLQANL
jgi:hypothetical protein